MGNQYIDAIWLLPIAFIIVVGWFMYRLGIEVGKDEARKEARAAAQRRHPASRPITGSNVVSIHRVK